MFEKPCASSFMHFGDVLIVKCGLGLEGLYTTVNNMIKQALI